MGGGARTNCFKNKKHLQSRDSISPFLHLVRNMLTFTGAINFSHNYDLKNVLVIWSEGHFIRDIIIHSVYVVYRPCQEKSFKNNFKSLMMFSPSTYHNIFLLFSYKI
jgi:hypothetical protein